MPGRVTEQCQVSIPDLSWGPLELTTLGCALLSLAICCVVTSSRKYFWFDELYTWQFVTDPSLRHMLYALYHGAGGAPPFYHLTMRAWTAIFGRSERAFRMPSCLAFMAALSITWVTLRRAFGRWPAAVGTLFVFGLSPLIMRQVAEARFYGLLTALVALAVYLYMRAVSRETVSRGLLVATWLTHVALLYTHFYGALYSGAILVAWIVCDRLHGRPWHGGYVAILLAWVAFLPWLPAARAVSDIGKPHNWVPVPGGREFLGAYSFSLQGTALALSLIVLYGALTMPSSHVQLSLKLTRLRSFVDSRKTKIVVAVLLAIYGFAGLRHPPTSLSWSVWLAPTLRFPGYHAVLIMLVLATIMFSRIMSRVRLKQDAAMPRRTVSSSIDDILLAGLSLLCVPIVSFAASHIGPSTFATQYLIPASLGLAPAIAYVAWWACTAANAPSEGASLPARRGWTTSIGWLALILFTAALPVVVNRRAPRRLRPGTEVEAAAPPNATVVVEYELGLLPLRHYQRRHDLTYVYPMDWTAASDASELATTTGYKQMAHWGRVGYADSTMLSGAQVPCADTQFVVLNERHNAWFDDRVRHDSALVVQRIGVPHKTQYGWLYLVRRRGAGPPSMCGEGLTRAP